MRGEIYDYLSKLNGSPLRSYNIERVKNIPQHEWENKGSTDALVAQLKSDPDVGDISFDDLQSMIKKDEESTSDKGINDKLARDANHHETLDKWELDPYRTKGFDLNR